ncbi:RagB/SusD family nutrient uptake outer membrane protein [Pleomorphovibrio marinus]|uniref:RagB/SusD family nutrient uptake outer membrane protein n=1 Tax=Pleomorphovibrio marinus TaxID=2164132 RepID=UPI000E0BD7E0|nr:RagB/SusD family nutrient uptake outer membrane protein [Pleomorphovibrio marinus]
MKTIKIKLLFGIMAAGLLINPGCSGFLDEDLQGQLVGVGALSSVEGLDAALTGAYKGLGWTWSMGFFHSTPMGATMGGDDITTHPASNKQEFREFDQFAVSPGNSRTGQMYTGCYKAIQGANNIIENWENTSGPEDRINEIVGEAYFLRAFSYYWLVRLYDGIPLIITPTFSEDLLSIGRTESSVIYDLIISDFEQAELRLPNSKRDPGRPNKGSAAAFLADVYLTMGGWPLHDTSKIPLAAQKAKEVIDNRATYGFDLVPTYEVLWANDPSGFNMPEEIFSLYAYDGVGQTMNAHFGFASMPGEQSGWEDFFAEINFFNNFPEGPRKDMTFRTEFELEDGRVLQWQDLQTRHPYYNKYYQAGDQKRWFSSIPLIMMRYAHVLTIYAEASTRELGSPSTEAYASINLIRNRAGLPELEGLSGEEFIEAVIDERAWEFAAERTRWFDLVRLERVEEANANKHPWDLQPIGGISKEDYTFPLPLTETLNNPNLQ